MATATKTPNTALTPALVPSALVPSPLLPPPAPSVDEMILAPSHIVLRREYRPPSPPRLTTSEKHPTASQKHLELLNLLSLLLVTEAKGDVAAAMFRVLSKDNLELHYAKNRPCTTDEKAYIHAIFATVCDMTSVSNTCWKPLSLVIPACKRKMMSRANKVCKLLAELPVTVAHTDCTVIAETFLRSAVGGSVFPLSSNMPDFIRSWFTHLLQKPAAIFKAWNTGRVYQMLHLSYSIGHAPDISRLLDPQLLRRIRKLGDYYRAALCLISNAATLPEAQLRHIRIIEVVPVLPRKLAVSADFVATINAWADHNGELPVSERALRTAFPDMDDRPADRLATQSVTVSVHCECTLLLAMLSDTPAMVELGVSKSSCFMCREFILAVQTRYRHLTVRVSSCHRKHVAGWSLPMVAPQGLIEHMEKRVRDEMDEVLQRATRNRKSDSVRVGSGPKDGVERPSAEEVVRVVEEAGGGMWRIV